MTFVNWFTIAFAYARFTNAGICRWSKFVVLMTFNGIIFIITHIKHLSNFVCKIILITSRIII